MPDFLELHVRNLYVRLTPKGKEHLLLYYSDSRRRFSGADTPGRPDAQKHHIYSGTTPTDWWAFSPQELHSIFSGLLLTDVVVGNISTVHPKDMQLAS